MVIATGKDSFWRHKELKRKNLSFESKKKLQRHKYDQLSDMHQKFSISVKVVKKEPVRLRYSLTADYSKFLEEQFTNQTIMKTMKEKSNAAAVYTYAAQFLDISPGFDWQNSTLTAREAEFSKRPPHCVKILQA